MQTERRDTGEQQTAAHDVAEAAPVPAGPP